MKLLVSIVLTGLLSRIAEGSPPLQYSYLREGGIIGKLMKTEDHREDKKVGIEPRYRLNGTWIPVNYNLDIAVLLDDDGVIGDQFTAPGIVVITARPTEATRVITLHANLLEIGNVVVKQVSDPSVVINVIEVTNDTESGRHFLAIQVDKELEVNTEYSIEIGFVAPVSTDRTNGLYLSSYIDPLTQETRRQAATQMEPLAARQMFPCFDEPGLKATFDVRITRRHNHISVFNTDKLSSEDLGNGYVQDVFPQTPPLPTYLVALFIGDSEDFSSVEALATVPEIPIRVYGRRDILEKGGFNYSVETTAEVFSRFNSYFNTSYPISKMDSVAVPVKGGAMENYGLILYRQDLLVYMEGETTEQMRYDSTDVIAHEVAHQNFGNLVTCKWWSDLWLNEGFATYMSHLGAEWTNPEFRSREKILNEIVQFALGVDAGSTSHPLKNEALSPSEVSEIFGSITYNKGGSIVRMVENFLTEGTFQKGLQYYLQEMEAQVVEQDDLFRNLQKAIDEDERLPNELGIKDVLDTWTLKKGFPLVKINVASPTSVIISQEAYRNDSEVGSDLWYVPVTVVTKDNPILVDKVPEIWLGKDEISIVRSHDTSTWLMINQDATGFYRVMYDEALLLLIRNQLELDSSVISPLSRSQLLDDYFTFAWDGKSRIEIALDLTVLLNTENHFTVWEAVFTHLEKSLRIFSGNEDQIGALRHYLLPPIDGALLRQGEADGIDRIFKSHLYDWACALGSSSCSDYATELYLAWQANPAVDPVPIDFARTLYCAMVDSGGAIALSFMELKYSEEPNGSKRQGEYRDAFGCARESVLLQRLIDNVLQQSPVKYEADRLPVLVSIAANPVGRQLVLDTLTEKLGDVIDVVGNGTVSPVANIVSALSLYYNTEEELSAVQQFVASNENILEPVRSQLEASLEAIRGNIYWMENFGTDILSWLQNKRQYMERKI